MNTAHWHLVLNHFPIIGTYLSILILGVGIFLKKSSVRNTGLLLLVFTALMTIPAFLTGEGAEDVLESIGQKNEHFIHEHEEIAETALWLTEVIGLLALISVLGWFNQKKYARFLTLVVFTAAIANSLLMVRVGDSGGEIRHTEIRNGSGATVDVKDSSATNEQDDD